MAIALLGTPTAGGTAGANGTGYTIAVPTAAQGVTDPNTLLLFTMVGKATTIAAYTAPAGWSTWQANTAVSTDFQAATWYRFASSEPASYTVSGLTSGQHAGNIRVYSGVDATTPQDVAVTVASSASAMVAPAAITPVTAGAWIDCTNTIRTAATTPATTFTSSNMTLDTNWGSTHATLANAVGGTAHYDSWTSGAFSPDVTQVTSTATRGVAFTSAIRPAATFTTYYILQEDGTSHLLKEDGSGALVTEAWQPVGDATLPVTAAVTAAGVVGKVGDATRSVTATVAAVGAVGVSSGATVAETVTVAAAGAVGVSSGSTLPLTATIAADGSAAAVGSLPELVMASRTY